MVFYTGTLALASRAGSSWARSEGTIEDAKPMRGARRSLQPARDDVYVAHATQVRLCVAGRLFHSPLATTFHDGRSVRAKNSSSNGKLLQHQPTPHYPAKMSCVGLCGVVDAGGVSSWLTHTQPHSLCDDCGQIF